MNRKQNALTLPGLLLASLCACQPVAHKASQNFPKNFTSPAATLKTYLFAVKHDDLETAIACHTASGAESGEALDTFVGIWVSYHQLNQVSSEKFGRDAKPLINADATDAAIDRTLARIESSEMKVDGDTALVLIKWEKDDGYPNSAFLFGSTPIPFKRIGAKWKFDLNKFAEIKSFDNTFDDAGLAVMMRDTLRVTRRVTADIEAGKYATVSDAQHALEMETEKLKETWQSSRKNSRTPEPTHEVRP